MVDFRTIAWMMWVGTVFSFCTATAFAEEPCVDLEECLKERYKACTDDKKLKVDLPDPGSDKRSTEIDRVVLETGSGHGGVVTIIEFLRDEDRLEMTRIQLRRGGADGTYREFHGQSPYRVEVRTGSTGLTGFDRAIRRVERLLEADLEVVDTDDDQSVCSWGSSHDFYVQVDLGKNGPSSRIFAGYKGSLKQLEYLPLKLAAEELVRLVPASAGTSGSKLTPVEITDAHRKLFVSRFRKNAGWFREDFRWWIGQAYTGAAAVIGTSDLVEPLEEFLTLPEKPDASDRRMRNHAINALAEITATDHRWTDGGKARPVDDVAADYLETE